jgi:hypothetical protein
VTLAELKASLARAQRRARHYSAKAKANQALAKRRARQIKALTVGPQRAVKWGLAQAGTAEKPNGSNWGPKISDWIKASGYGSPVPWCQCFANAVAVHGGAPQLRTGYTPSVLAGIGGYKRVTAKEARAGDMVFFKFPGVSGDTCDHVGVLLERPGENTVKDIEGNTSPGNSGSQNNGQGVYVRTRPKSMVAGYVRPPYPKE